MCDSCVPPCVVDEMYVLSASNKRVNVQLVGKDKIQDKLSHFEELTSASISYLGVSSPGVPCDIGATVPSKFYLHHFEFLFIGQTCFNLWDKKFQILIIKC